MVCSMIPMTLVEEEVGVFMATGYFNLLLSEKRTTFNTETNQHGLYIHKHKDTSSRGTARL